MYSFCYVSIVQAIIHAARGIASCSKSLNREEYLTNICTQMAELIGAKESNKFVVTACVHVLDILIDKKELAVFSVFYPKLFAPFLIITQQPYYGTLEYSDPSHTSWDTSSIERAIRGLTRIMITGSVMPNIMDACSLLIPAVFHAYVFAESSKSIAHR